MPEDFGNLSFATKKQRNFKFQKFLVVFLIAIVLFLVLVSAYYFTLRSRVQDESAPVPTDQPEVSVTLPASTVVLDDWELELIQPRFVGFESVDGMNFVLLDVDGRQIKGLVSTASSSDLLSEGTYFIQKGADQSELPPRHVFEKLNEFLVEGEQIGVWIINKYPESLADTDCTENSYYCSIYGLVTELNNKGIAVLNAPELKEGIDQKDTAVVVQFDANIQNVE